MAEQETLDSINAKSESFANEIDEIDLHSGKPSE
jgi:hypothetical protein